MQITTEAEKGRINIGEVSGFKILATDTGFVRVAISETDEEILTHQIPLFDSKRLPDLIKVRHAKTEDFNIIQLTTEKAFDDDTGTEHTFGYCLNIDDPDLSEWGWW